MVNHIVKFLILFELERDNHFLWHTTFTACLDLGCGVYIVAVKYSLHAVLITQAEAVLIS
jgi:hypothetical protein